MMSAIGDSTHHDDFCIFLYSKDTNLNDTLHFNFEDREDFGPVYLSDNELKQIYCEIKRGNTDAYNILCNHFFYSYSQNIPPSEIDKLICITDFLAQKFHYNMGYLACGNYIFEYLNNNADDHYASIMITYYEKYFNYSQSKSIAKKLYDIYCGKYYFHEKDSEKAEYYSRFVYDN